MADGSEDDMNDTSIPVISEEMMQNHEAFNNYNPSGMMTQQDFYNVFALRPPNGRQQNSLNDINIRGAWSQQEDEMLANAVKQLGCKKWMDIAKFVPSRTSKQCRERWIQRLAPNIRHEPFEPWEDKIILDKQAEIGNRWSIISQSLNGRSSSAIKNRWYSCLRNQKVSNVNIAIIDYSIKDLVHDSNDIVSQNTDL